MPTVPAIDYSSRDFQTILSDLKKLIPHFTAEWTNQEADDFGVVLLELFSANADVLHWYIDRLAGENFLDTAIARRSVIKLLALIGVKMKGSTAARVDLVFYVTSAPLVDILIPAKTKVSTGTSGVVFETDVAGVILAGQTSSAPIAATQGETVSLELLGVSDGRAYQKYTVEKYPIVPLSMRVFVGGILWSEIESLGLAGVDDQVYEVRYDENEQATVYFGDGMNGKIPDPVLNIEVTYQFGCGTIGNVGYNTITTVLGAFSPPIKVTNPGNAAGGAGPETIEDAKRRAPAEFKSVGRAVTLEDYEALALTVSGVAKARAAVVGPSRVGVYIAPSGGGTPPPSLLVAVKDFLDTVRMVTDGVEVASAEYVQIDLAADVRVKSAFRQIDVQTAVIAAVEDFFLLENREFGKASSPEGDVRLSDIVYAIESVTGVDYVELSRLTLVPAPVWRIKSGDASFGPVISLSVTTIPETWTVRFNSDTTFSVTGSVSGLQSGAGTLGVPYTSDNDSVLFTINAGAVPMVAGDYAEFRVSQLVGSVDILPTEIATKGTITLTFAGGV